MPSVRRKIFAVPVDNPLTSRTLFGPPCRVHGVGLRETTGVASALIILHNGAGTADLPVLPYGVGAAGTTRDWFGESGIDFDDGVFCEVVNGTLTGCVFISELAADVFAETDIGRALTGGE